MKYILVKCDLMYELRDGGIDMAAFMHVAFYIFPQQLELVFI